MEKIVEFSQVSFTYDKKKPLIDIPSLALHKGEKLFIHGASGSGKSTFLKLTAGLLSPHSGNIAVLGKNLTRLSSKERDRLRVDHLGFIFQDFNLISYLTVYENILLALKASPRRHSRIKRAPLYEIARLAKHLQIESYLKKPVTKLSIGQQQRVAVARALIGSPEIVIADEPTSALDEDNATRFMKLLMKEHQEEPFSLIFVGHDRRLATWFDRQISLVELMS